MRILVVCLGNICRSPLAEAALSEELAAVGLGDEVTVDSAGTGDWNVGKPPDERMLRAAGAAGLSYTGTARMIDADDVPNSDLILVMDRQNLRDVLALAPDDQTRAKVRLYLDYAGQGDAEVPDPYHGGAEDFEAVVPVVRDAAKAIAAQLRSAGVASSI
jgi:protein-tyrosine phosphatase